MDSPGEEERTHSNRSSSSRRPPVIHSYKTSSQLEDDQESTVLSCASESSRDSGYQSDSRDRPIILNYPGSVGYDRNAPTANYSIQSQVSSTQRKLVARPRRRPRPGTASTSSTGSHGRMLDTLSTKAHEALQQFPSPWEQYSFCLACDRQTIASDYCSDACRLSDAEKAKSAGIPPMPSISESDEVFQNFPVSPRLVYGLDVPTTGEQTRSLPEIDDQDPPVPNLREKPILQSPKRYMLQQTRVLDMVIGDPDLVYMWPQVVLRAGNLRVASQHVAGFVRSYIQDFKKQHPSADIKLPILKSRIANIFLPGERNFEEAFRALMGSRKHDVCTSVLHLLLHELKMDNAEDMDIEPHLLRSPDRNLVDESAIGVLRFRVRKYLEETTVPLVSPRSRIHVSARRAFENASTRLYRPAVPPTMERIHWTCKCGHHLYDDYVEMVPGALRALELRLNSGNSNSRPPNQNHSFMGTVSSLLTLFQFKNSQNQQTNGDDSAKSNKSFLPLSNDQANLKLGMCPRGPSSSPDKKHNYLLACVPFMRWVPKVHQVEVCTIMSDRDFFTSLRAVYDTCRQRFLRVPLRKVKSIRFVEFEMHMSEIADILSYPSLPPQEMKSQYLYKPIPPKLMPPVGSNLLVHLFENPDHANVLPYLFEQIPKRLHEKLSVLPSEGASKGWGIEFVEGIDTFVFFLCGCLCFILCLAIAVIWTAIKDDVQGGFGIGGFILAFMVFCGELARSSIQG